MNYQLMLFIILILHQTTTSIRVEHRDQLLFIILILHQTTTILHVEHINVMLFIILILHQTTTRTRDSNGCTSCLLS